MRAFVERANNNVDGDFLHLATALVPQWKVIIKSNWEACWRKLRAEMDLLKGEEDVTRARDMVDAPKLKRRPMCALHHTGREGILLDGAAPEQEEAEHFNLVL